MAVGCTSDPAPKYSEPEVERFVQTSEAKWAASVATNDASILQRILSDDIVWVLDDRVLGKATAIREAAEGPAHFVSNKLDYAHVRFFGSAAVAQGREHWVKRDPRRIGHFIWTNTGVLRNGAWRVVNSQDTSVMDGGT